MGRETGAAQRHVLDPWPIFLIGHVHPRLSQPLRNQAAAVRAHDVILAPIGPAANFLLLIETLRRSPTERQRPRCPGTALSSSRTTVRTADA